MVNLYMGIYPVYAYLSQSASGLRRIEQSDVSDCFGFISQDALR